MSTTPPKNSATTVGILTRIGRSGKSCVQSNDSYKRLMTRQPPEESEDAGKDVRNGTVQILDGEIWDVELDHFLIIRRRRGARGCPATSGFSVREGGCHG